MDTNREQNLHSPRRAGGLSVLLTLAALVCLLLALAATANAETIASGYCGGEGDGTNLTWTLDSEGTLTISGRGKMKDYNAYSGQLAPWCEDTYRPSLKKLVLSNGVSTIGFTAFYNCSGFTGRLIIPNSVYYIMGSAFYGCSGFTGDLVIPDYVTFIGNDAFRDCSGFNGTLTLSRNLTKIGQAVFCGCSGLSGTLVIPDKVTSIGDSAFYGCKGFTDTLSIPDSVTSIGYAAFCLCDHLIGLNIPDSVTYIGDSAFCWCANLQGTVTIPDGVTSIGRRVFDTCTNLGNIILPNKLQDIGEYAFRGCWRLSVIRLPNSITSIDKTAFDDCRALQTVYYDGTRAQLDKLFQFPSTVEVICSQGPGSNGTELSFDKEEYTAALGAETVLTVRLTTAAGKAQEQLDSIKWASSDPDVFPKCEYPIKWYVSSPYWSYSSGVLDAEKSTGYVKIYVTPKYVGSSTITLTTADGASTTCKFTIPGSPNTVRMDESIYTIKAGETGTVFADIYNTQAISVVTKWTSGNASIVSITDSPETIFVSTGSLSAGILHDSKHFRANSPGTTTITCTLANGNSVSRTITVLAADNASEQPTISSNEYDVPKYEPSPNKPDLTALEKECETWKSKYKWFNEDKVGKVLSNIGKEDAIEIELNETLESRAEKMMEADNDPKEACLTFDPDYPVTYKKDAYVVLCKILDDRASRKGISYKDLSVQKLMDGTWAVKEERKVEGKNASFNCCIFGFIKLGTGDLTLQAKEGSYLVVFNSSQSATKKVVEAYLESCKELATEAVKKAKEAYIEDTLKLISVSDLSDLAKSVFLDNLSSGLKPYGSLLKSNGLEDLKEAMEALYDFYYCYNTVYNKLKNSTGYSYFSDVEAVQKALTTLDDYSFENKIVSGAFKQLKNAGKDLYNKLDNVVKKQEEEKKNWSKRTQINCAVNVSIFASDGTQIGYVGDDGSWHTDAISIEENDDSKIIYSMAEDQISFKVEGYESDYVSCVFEDFADGAPVGRFNFYDIWLDEGQAFQVALPAEQMQEVQDSFTLDVDGQTAYGEYISADQRASVNVTVVPDNADGGTVTGGGCYVRGDAVVLRAAVNTGFSFAGWYDEQDMLVSSDFFYEFTAREDLTLHVKFVPHPPLVQTGRIAPSDRYEGLVDIYCEQSESGVDIQINPIDSSVDPRTFTATAVEYDADGRLVSILPVQKVSAIVNRIAIFHIKIQQYGIKIFILDADGRPVMRALVSE